MKILTAEQIRALDRFTIENEPVSSFDLMERAAISVLNAFPKGKDWDLRPVFYFCGKGNNGGDGLAMARIQSEREEREITVVVLEHMEQGSVDFGKNLYHLQGEETVAIIHIDVAEELPEIPEDAIVVDAILGSGLSRPLDGFLADVVQRLNQLENFKLSIDMPTGLFSEDNTKNDLTKVFRADLTVTFHCPKLSLMLPDSGVFAGEIQVQDIGLLEEQMQADGPFRYVVAEDLRPIIKKRAKFSHKGTYGHALLLAGSRGKMGAAQLAAAAAMRAGAGLVTAHVPACGLDILQLGIREAMCSVDANEHFITEFPKLEPFSTIAIGPGIGTEKDTANALKRLIQDAKVPLLIDADALNVLSENKTWLSFLPKNTILTPHPKEFERLAGTWKTGYERLQLQMEFSRKYGVIVVLKGAHTSTSTPAGQVFFNSNGNPGMATAGSGDVLTGVILGLLSQGYSPEVAAVFGVHLHAQAGDAAAFLYSENAVMASDMVHHLGNAFRDIAQDDDWDVPFLSFDEE
ncbi:MAG: NAD(P)H-hydrate dehydratase [Flavobacteriales bacterium]|nr:NAD(P)H-hydrate dehydratase [Flavobacteriales bacterium]